MQKFIRKFDEIGLGDINLVGGKNASLGELKKALTSKGIAVPDGFAITVDAYESILNSGRVLQDLEELFQPSNEESYQHLSERALQARAIIKKAGLPDLVKEEIIAAYRDLSHCSKSQNLDVAVRSSATAEDLPNASFAGQQESFLNIRGETALLEACLNCFASIFTERAISYRIDKGFDHLSVKLSVGVQKMVRSDLGCSGVMFTLDTESGFRDAILITSAYGLGENIVAGRVDPDEYLVFKPTLKSGFKPILRRKIGAKQQRLIYACHGSRTTENISVPNEDRIRLSLHDSEVIALAKSALLIEEHYIALHGKDVAMDIEWAKDGSDSKMYIVQARPETIFSPNRSLIFSNFKLEEKGEVILQGRAIGNRIGTGKTRLIRSKKELSSFVDGEVLVTDMTDPDWEPVMKRASAIITNRGGRTCHAAIISRELAVPCIVGTGKATALLFSGQEVTVNCSEGSEGKVYAGLLSFSQNQIDVSDLPRTDTQVMINIGEPDLAFSLARLPVAGVGLARLEFIITNDVRVHPLALTRFDQVTNLTDREAITNLTSNYSQKSQYFIDKLAEGVSTIAAAFYPKPVIVRLSDFKSNEYANLLGGQNFEPKENNPMIGFRGASRYYSENYRDGFALECLALKAVRDDMGLTNVKLMVPFCRTIEEAQRVLLELETNGLKRGENALEVYVMCEIPANVILADLFAKLFDGFSIGSNDLTQLVLGIDRDSELIAGSFDERNPAVMRMIAMAIASAKKAGRKIGICGQAPSDYPEFVKFLVQNGIDSMSLNADAVLKTISAVAIVENATQKENLTFENRSFEFLDHCRNS
jgi:pyruvate, water dikinase